MSKVWKRLFVFTTFVVAFLLLLGGFLFYISLSKPSRADRDLETTSPVAQQDHARVDQLVQALTHLNKQKAKDGKKDGKSDTVKQFTVSARELNSYIAQEMKAHPPKGMKSLVVDLKEPNHVSATALLDFSQIKMPDNSFAAAAAKKLLSGDRYVKVEGTLDSQQNMGAFSIDRAEVAGMPLPTSLVTMLVKRIGEKQHPPVDITKPFNLPYGIERLEISNGAIKIKS
jgi:hypothetical protein